MNTAYEIPTPAQVMELRREFAKRLRSRMAAHDLSPKSIELTSLSLVLQGQCKRGINRTSVYKYLEGNTLPSPALLEVLCLVLRCQPEDLMTKVEHLPPTRGRRKVLHNTAYVAAKRTSLGLEYGRLQVDVTLPMKQLTPLYSALRQHFRKAGMTLEPADRPGTVQ